MQCALRLPALPPPAAFATRLPSLPPALLLRTLPQHRTQRSGVATMAAAGGRDPAEQLLSVAPMMEWTDIHFRQLARLLSRRTWLWTEMVVDQTLMHNPSTDRFLWFPPEQRPIVCQLGGSNPQTLAAAARLVADYGYDEINLNCGCPSDRVAGAGCFGAALMLQPQVVADACQAMRAAVGDLPVTVKCRLGVDNVDSYEELCRFVATVAQGSGVRHFIMHARKCLLKGLNPHQNRTVPPLRYEWVFALKRDFPHLEFSLNGGIQTPYEAASALAHRAGGGHLHGVMIGRGAYNAPWDCLADADRAVFGEANPATNRRQVLEEYGRYGDGVVGRWEVRPNGWRSPGTRAVIQPLLNLFRGQPGSRRWKQAVEAALRDRALLPSELLAATLVHIPAEVLDAPPRPPPGESSAAFATSPLPPPVALRALSPQRVLDAPAELDSLAHRLAGCAGAASSQAEAGTAVWVRPAGSGQSSGDQAPVGNSSSSSDGGDSGRSGDGQAVAGAHAGRGRPAAFGRQAAPGEALGSPLPALCGAKRSASGVLLLEQLAGSTQRSPAARHITHQDDK